MFSHKIPQSIRLGYFYFIYNIILEINIFVLYNNLNNFVNLKDVEILGCSSNNTTLFAADSLSVLSAAEKIRSIWGECPKACVRTYGCQMNVSDSEKIKGVLCLLGYTLCEDPSEADFIISNTCAVRDHAEKRVLGNIGALKKFKVKDPAPLIAICGCMAQRPEVSERIKRSYPYVDLCFGTNMIHKIPEMINKRLSGKKRIIRTELNDKEMVEGLPTVRDNGFRAWLPIMYGCNNFCTYCIVPYVRGREISRAPEAIVADAEKLIASGAKDITLLGQNVNSYNGGITFAQLLRRINDIPGDFRIRFMTSHPKDCSEELLKAMADCDKVAKHLHLPVQSGSDRILKEMNRKYTSSEYLALVEKAKQLIPDISFTSDIIVGFPGETYDDFKATLELIKKVRYDSLFTFIFSPREGTPAAGMEDVVSREEKGRWFEELLAEQDIIAKELAAEMVGREYTVLCTEAGRTEGFMAGQTSSNQIIEFPGDNQMIGKFHNVKVNKLGSVLEGTLTVTK